MLARLPERHPARGELQRLIGEAHDAATWIRRTTTITTNS
jgi:hypothetical protein